MDDIEITKRCADAMGFKSSHTPFCGFILEHGYDINYQPLINDAQCLALVRKLKISITAPEPPVLLYWIADVWVDKNRGREARGKATTINRAICLCVSSMPT